MKTFHLVHLDVLFRSALDITKWHVQRTGGFMLENGKYNGYAACVNTTRPTETIAPFVSPTAIGYPVVTLTQTPRHMHIQLETPLFKISTQPKLVVYVTQSTSWSPTATDGFTIFCFHLAAAQTNLVEPNPTLAVKFDILCDALDRHKPICNVVHV